MAISLQKGGNVNLSKEAPAMTEMLLGLGWDARATDGAAFDLDACAFMLNAEGKVVSEKSFVYYNNLVSECGGVTHTGDNLTGEGDGDDEAMIVKFDAIPEGVDKIAICVTIHDAEARGQNFGMVSEASIRCVDQASGSVIADFDLSEDACTNTALVFGEVYRNKGSWKFKAVGQGFDGGLQALVTSYGL